MTTSRRNGHADDPHDRAWALAEIWGDLTHLQSRALYGALASDDRDAFNIVANQHKRAGLRGLTGHAIEAFSILRSEIVDDGRERNTNTDDDAEQAANDEREQNPKRRPLLRRPSPASLEMAAEWIDVNERSTNELPDPKYSARLFQVARDIEEAEDAEAQRIAKLTIPNRPRRTR